MKRLFGIGDAGMILFLLVNPDVLLALTAIGCFITGINLVRFRLNKKRLNDCYVYSYWRKGEAIEIHYNPVWFFHWYRGETVLGFRHGAVQELEERYPDKRILGRTMTLNRLNEDSFCTRIGTLAPWRRLTALVPSLIVTTSNLCNLFSFSLTRKLFLILFQNPFVLYQYKSEPETIHDPTRRKRKNKEKE
ncbi:hypothetical protein IMZ31_19820 (plasmid) [Pontibacillus sp. ALD_SL1]|uniref:hypothetical protein n=1 Tax=Pontibacillus sp. ALD_SL1 TaxID=2777185 RepID=UPI001A968B49|nr:hypothetical protein [Pontibacillus sp. ALD_SL1]QST02800.1 hypothetical protein IMZ31_19820 [Pontibacillus sp. ALD_SL1]